MIRLWLDDIRPAPEGWVHVRTVEEAKHYMAAGDVVEASLDHDLGMESMETGYDFVCWMEEKGCWPMTPPRVHSANPVGRAKMEAAIERSWNYEC